MGKLSSKALPTVEQRRVDLCAVKRVDAHVRSRRPPVQTRINVLRLNDSPQAYATVFYARSQPDSLKMIMSYRHAEEISLWTNAAAR